MSRLLFLRFASAPVVTTFVPPTSLFPFWGTHFPDVYKNGHPFWSRHFPDGGQSPVYFGGYGPPGSAPIAVDMDSEFTLTLSWDTDVIKARAGGEERIAAGDNAPAMDFQGSAILWGQDPTAWRARLARYAAAGSSFLFGMPHEGLTLTADAGGNTVFVGAAAAAAVDWLQIGQRVISRNVDPTTGANVYAQGIVQSYAAGAVALDVAPGSAGRAGGVLLPGIAVVLQPQQDFGRYPTAAERWQMRSLSVVFDFSPTHATVNLGAASGNAALNGATLVCRVDGVAGNLRSAQFADGATTGAGTVTDATTGSSWLTTFTLKGGTSTLDDLRTLSNTSPNMLLVGTWAPGQVISSADIAAIGLRALAGGSGEGLAGTGVALTTYNGAPVWDRGLNVDSTADDSVQALTEIIQRDGKPYALPVADAPDWGRAVRLDGQLGLDWQYVKRFLWTVRGRQQSFWVPTARPDFTYWSNGVGTVTIRADDGSDFFAWYPAQRANMQVTQADGTVTRAAVVGAVDNGDGTITLSLINPVSGIPTTLSGSAVTMLSWLELCRFESDTFAVRFNDDRFLFETVARVVQS